MVGSRICSSWIVTGGGRETSSEDDDDEDEEADERNLTTKESHLHLLLAKMLLVNPRRNDEPNHIRENVSR